MAAFLAGADFELDFVTVAKVIEQDLGGQARAMKKHLVAAVVGYNESETLILDNLLYCAVHKCLADPRDLIDREPGPAGNLRLSFWKLTRPGLYVKQIVGVVRYRPDRHGKETLLLKAVTLKEIERIFEIIEPLGISREAVVIPLRPDHPGRVRILPNGKLEIVVERDDDLDQWMDGLSDQIRALLNQAG